MIVHHRATLTDGGVVTVEETIGMEHWHRFVVKLHGAQTPGLKLALSGYLSYREAKGVFSRSVLIDNSAELEQGVFGDNDSNNF